MADALQTQRYQVAQAALAGYLDANLASDLTTATGNGYVPDELNKTVLDSAPIDGVKR